MLGIIDGIDEAYDRLTEEDDEEAYGVPVFYDDEELYDHLLDE
jgi:hypothetical protein